MKANYLGQIGQLKREKDALRAELEKWKQIARGVDEINTSLKLENQQLRAKLRQAQEEPQ